MESTATVNPDEKKFIVDSGTSVHMMSKMDLPPEELETVKVSLTSHDGDHGGSINATEEATVYVKDLDMFVTVQLRKDTPAVLSLGKTLRTKIVSYEWKEGSEPQAFQK